MRTFPQPRRKPAPPVRTIRTERTSRGILLHCSSAVHGARLKELGFKVDLLTRWYWPAEKLKEGRIPGPAREYVKRFYVGSIKK